MELTYAQRVIVTAARSQLSYRHLAKHTPVGHVFVYPKRVLTGSDGRLMGLYDVQQIQRDTVAVFRTLDEWTELLSALDKEPIRDERSLYSLTGIDPNTDGEMDEWANLPVILNGANVTSVGSTALHVVVRRTLNDPPPYIFRNVTSWYFGQGMVKELYRSLT